VWTASDTFKIGDLYVGVRSHPAALSNRVRSTLADHVVEGMDAPPNYSLRLETREPGRKGPARAYALYRSQCLLLRTRKRERVLRALVRCLSGHVGSLDGLVRVRQLAVVGSSGAVILPHELHWRLEAQEALLGANAMWLADPPFIDIDAATGELVFAPPTIDFDAAALGAGSDRPVPYGRYPIREWAILGRGEDETVTAHAALAAVMPMVGGDANHSAAMEAILHTLSRTRVTRVRHDSRVRLFERLVAAGR
jgi:hypothetical protein